MTATILPLSSSSSPSVPLLGVKSQDDLPTLDPLVWAPPAPTQTISRNSLRRLCGESLTVMICGFTRCLYDKVSKAALSQMSRCYDYTLGDDTNTFIGTFFKTEHYRERLDGTRIYQVTSGLASEEDVNSLDIDGSWGCVCKAALANIILENLESIKNGRPITPIIFCIALKNNLPPTSAEILSKKVLPSGGITLKEIRRAEKLANDRRIDPDIRAVTRRSVKFVEVEEVRTVTADGQENVEYHLTEIAPPWANPEFPVLLRKRQAISTRRPKTPKRDDVNWRAQLNRRAAEIRGPADESGLLQVHPHTGRRLESDAGGQIDDGIKTTSP